MSDVDGFYAAPFLVVIAEHLNEGPSDVTADLGSGYATVFARRDCPEHCGAELLRRARWFNAEPQGEGDPAGLDAASTSATSSQSSRR